jgi:hypothetical protein
LFVPGGILKGHIMATSSPATVRDITEQKNTPRSVFFNPFTGKNLPTLVLGLTIMAVVTLTQRAIDSAETGFALEWAMLTVVALVTFGLCARVIRRGTRAVQAWCADYAIHAQKTRADVKLWETARQDPRVMHEILAAQGRAVVISKNVRLRAGSL